MDFVVNTSKQSQTSNQMTRYNYSEIFQHGPVKQNRGTTEVIIILIMNLKNIYITIIFLL